MTKPENGKSLAGNLELFFDTLIHDVRFAFRQIVRRPGFSLLVVLTLAVGIGGSAAIFSVLEAIPEEVLDKAEEIEDVPGFEHL